MKSKEIYTVIAVVVLVGVLGWWAASRDSVESVDAENQVATTTGQNTSAKPTTSSKPASTTPKPQTSVNPTVTPAQPKPVMVTSKDLVGSTFRLTTFKGVSVPADSKYTLVFTDNSFSLKLCNTFNSNYYIDGNTMKATNVMSTKMYCTSPANIMDMETDASVMLNSGEAMIYRSGSTLILSHSSGVVMSFEGF